MIPPSDAGDAGHDPAAQHPAGTGAEPEIVIAGRYRVIRLLGEGAMGAVYLAEHLRMGRRDAIKVLRGGLEKDAESIARFHRGARNLSAIRHPNVCTLYDYGETEDGAPFLALEFITGETLKDLVVRENALAPERAIRIARQIADALDAAHDAGIVHRDLKPANIMLERARDGSDVVKVVDFDIAKGPDPVSGDEVTRLGFVVGTPEYMSPEQLMGEKLDGASDVYSLGIVLFRMLTGVLPFQGTSERDIMVQRLTNPPLTLAQVRPDISFAPGLQAVLDRAMARDRADRYARAEDISRDLAALLDRSGASSPVAGSATPAAAAARPTEPPPPPPAYVESVPETRVSPPPVQAGSERRPAPSRSAATAAPKRIGARLRVVGAIVVIIGAGVAVWAIGGSGDEATPNGGLAQPGTDPVEGDSSDLRQAGGSSAADSGVIPMSGGGNDPPPATDPDPPIDTRPALSAQDADAMLLRQLDGVATDDTALRRAARDTAELIYAMNGMAAAARARAAYVLANVFLVENDGPTCELWIQRAIDLRPDFPAYRTFVNSCRARSQ